MNDILTVWRARVLGDEIAVNAIDINDEANRNLLAFGFASEEAANHSTADLKAFFDDIVSDRRETLRRMRVATGAMRFYVWHDEMAAQLCFSLVSTSHGRLPFKCDLATANEIEAVLDSFLKSRYHEGIPWSELSESAGSSEPDEVFFALSVWEVRIP